MVNVTQLTGYAAELRTRRMSAADAAEWSQTVFERILARAETTRRRDFRRALEQGLGLDALAEAVGLEVEDVEAIVRG